MNIRHKHHLDNLRSLLEALIELKGLTSDRRKLYDEAKDKKKEVLGLVIKEYVWLLKNDFNTWMILKEIGLEYENNLYSLKRKLRNERGRAGTRTS